MLSERYKCCHRTLKYSKFLFNRSPSQIVPGGALLSFSFCYLIVFVGGTWVRSGTFVEKFRVGPEVREVGGG